MSYALEIILWYLWIIHLGCFGIAGILSAVADKWQACRINTVLFIIILAPYPLLSGHWGAFTFIAMLLVFTIAFTAGAEAGLTMSALPQRRREGGA